MKHAINQFIEDLEQKKDICKNKFGLKTLNNLLSRLLLSGYNVLHQRQKTGKDNDFTLFSYTDFCHSLVFFFKEIYSTKNNFIKYQYHNNNNLKKKPKTPYDCYFDQQLIFTSYHEKKKK